MRLEILDETGSIDRKLIAAIAAVCVAGGITYKSIEDAQTGNTCVNLSPITWVAAPLGHALEASGLVESPAIPADCQNS